MLLLLLGCAVQCEKKEEYIKRIQALDFDTQVAIAAHIQELTHSRDSVMDLHWLETSDPHPVELEAMARSMAAHLKRLLDQRDAHLEEREGVVSPPSSPPSPSMQQHQAGVQQHLADSKAWISRLQEELEEKSEQVLDGRRELENMEAELKRTQHELSVEARAARTYRDELDALRERAIRADKLESEVGRYKERLHNMDFYKAKVEKLKKDNRVLQETKEGLEDQLAGRRGCSEKMQHQLQKHGLLVNARLHDMEQEKEVDRRRIEDLQEENLALCLAQRRSMEESQLLGWELEQLSKTSVNPQGQQSLSEEVSERTHSRLLRLENENQRLVRTIEELQAAAVNSSPQCSYYQVLDDRVFQQDLDDCTKAAEPTCIPMLNDGANEAIPTSITQHTFKVHSNVHDQPNVEQFIGRQSEGLRADVQGCEDREKGQLDEWESREHAKELVPAQEVAQNSQHGKQHAAASFDHPLGFKTCRAGPSTRSCHATKHAERLEARCRALDTENQRLQASLDNSGRRLQRLEAEVQELEAENQSLQVALEEMRFSSRRLEQLELEKHSLEQESAGLEKEKRRLEKENRRLRQQAEIQETTLDSSSAHVASLERETRTLGKELEGLRETAERVKGLEKDNRELAKQAAIDQQTLATLRKELVDEKLKSQQRNSEFERLSHELEMDQEGILQKDQEASDNSRFNMLESELERSLRRSLQIKEDKMVALDARLQESSSLNQQLRQELKILRLSYEALLQREEEERAASGCVSFKETGRTINEWQRDSQEATKELVKVKDRLIEVERTNATLEAECQAMRAQLKQLGSQSDGQQAQILVLQRQTASLQENNTSLQTYNANLQVEKSTANSQSASLQAQNAQLQQQRSGVESERDSALREREELRGVHEQLLRDHERLSALHERQAMEYEALMGRHGCLNNAHRTLELEQRTLQDRYKSLLQQRRKLEELERALEEEQRKMAREKEQHRTAAAECRRLRDEKDWLNQMYHQLLKDNKELSADHKQLKSQLNGAQLEHAQREADFSKLREQCQKLDITSTKLTNQCELFSQLKDNLEEENRHLLSQVQSLMLQNRTLLEQTMESKDLFHAEQRQHIDKLNELRRQKEKLEEKIMDQYKFYDPSPTRRRVNWIALRMKELIKSRREPRFGSERSQRPVTPTHSGSCEGLEEAHLPCQDNGSFVGSDGSGGSCSTPAADALSPKRSSNKDSNDSASGFEDNEDLQHHGLNGTQSGEFNLSMDNEPWSNGSSPVQQPLSCRSTSAYQPPKDSSSPCHTQQQQQQHNVPKTTESSPVLINNNIQDSQIQCRPAHLDEAEMTQEVWPIRGMKTIRRGSKPKSSRPSSDSGGSFKLAKVLNGMNSKSSSSAKTETTNTEACSAVTVLYVQGKSSSVSGCLNCFSTPLGREGRIKASKSPKILPRASNVISTAEGFSWRSSVNSDCRAAAEAVPQPARVLDINNIEVQGTANQNQQPGADTNSDPDPAAPLKPPRDPAVTGVTDRPKSPVQENMFGSPFTFNSVFSNTIFGDAVVTAETRLEESENKGAVPRLDLSMYDESQTLASVETEPSERLEHGCDGGKVVTVLGEKDMIA